MKLSTKAQVSLDRVIEQFKAGDLSPVVEIARLHRKGDPVPFDKWSFCNRIMAYVQTGSTDLRGYNQWRSVGRQVKKGSCAAFILAPRFKKEQDDKTGKESQQMIGFLSIAVFPYHSTQGEPLPEHDYEPRQLPPLADVAARLNVAVTWQPLPPDRLGQWNGKDQIDVGTHDTSTFFHELAHAAHTQIDGPKKKRGQDPRRETIADFTACVLMHLYGLGDRTGNTWRYIAGYHKDPLIAIMKALAMVEQVLALILDEPTEEANVIP
ncbi:MAG: M48 family peptidase [Chloroflexi bacterium]|nr:M48 family peptidase [Chloroflexota bacterium]